MQRRFKFYENEVLKKYIQSKSPGNLIETNIMKDLLLTCAKEHEEKRERNNLSIEKYYSEPMLKESLDELKQNLLQVGIEYRTPSYHKK